MKMRVTLPRETAVVEVSTIDILTSLKETILKSFKLPETAYLDFPNAEWKDECCTSHRFTETLRVASVEELNIMESFKVVWKHLNNSDM